MRAELVTMRAGVPPALADAIHRKATAQGISASAFMRELLALGMGETNDVPTPRKMTPKASKPLLEPLPLGCPVSPYDLFARGYSANQIAAVLKMPYREVLGSIGKRVDAMKVGH